MQYVFEPLVQPGFILTSEVVGKDEQYEVASVGKKSLMTSILALLSSFVDDTWDSSLIEELVSERIPQVCQIIFSSVDDSSF